MRARHGLHRLGDLRDHGAGGRDDPPAAAGGLLAAFAELLAPTRCAGCDYPGALLCERCLAQLPRIDPLSACPCCAAPYGALVCTECWNRELAFDAAVAVGELDGALSRAVVLHKDAGERRLGALLGELLAHAVLASTVPGSDSASASVCAAPPDAVTWIPPSRSALVRRGFDHGRPLAMPVAVALGVPCVPLLVRPDARDQRRLGRTGRLAAAGFSAGEAPERVLVVDDVLTTGATLEAAAQALRQAGAVEVRCAVVARAW